MQVVYAIATSLGRGGLAREALYELQAIYAAGCLRTAVVYGNRQTVIPKRYMYTVWFQPTKVFSSLPARYYYGIKKRYFDWVAARVLRSGADIFHGWTGDALLSLRQAHAIGAIAFLEHPAPHVLWHERLMAEEYALCGLERPAVSRVPPFKRFPITPEHTLAEYALADYLVVQSAFCRQTFVDAGVAADRLLVVSQGVDGEQFKPAPKADRIFRVVFVGALTLRKGVRYLLQAWAELQLEHAELVLVGSLHDEVRPLLRPYLGLRGLHLKGHVPDPVSLYQQASVFVLPSLVEGNAKVIYEAMACGLPVIVTPNTGAEITDGIEGAVVAARDVEGLKEKLLFFYTHEQQRQEMGEAARALALQLSWEHRGRLLLSAYRMALKDRGQSE